MYSPWNRARTALSWPSWSPFVGLERLVDLGDPVEAVVPALVGEIGDQLGHRRVQVVPLLLGHHVGAGRLALLLLTPGGVLVLTVGGGGSGGGLGALRVLVEHRAEQADLHVAADLSHGAFVGVDPGTRGVAGEAGALGESSSPAPRPCPRR
jgi:hypothetical protein